MAPPYMLNASAPSSILEKPPILFSGGGIYPTFMDVSELEAIERRNKEIINWNSLNLTACFQVNLRVIM